MSAKPDILADVAAEEAKRNCKHPHVKFERNGFQLRCIDCNRRYVAAWNDPNTKMETFMADFMYRNPQITEGSFLHSPDEPPRTKPKT